MGRPAQRSDSTARIAAGHGVEGYVALRAEVPWYVKDELIDIAVARGVTLREAITEALERYVSQAGDE